MDGGSAGKGGGGEGEGGGGLGGGIGGGWGEGGGGLGGGEGGGEGGEGGAEGGVIPTNWRMASSLVSHWALAAARTWSSSAVQPQVRGGGLGE